MNVVSQSMACCGECGSTVSYLPAALTLTASLVTFVALGVLGAPGLWFILPGVGTLASCAGFAVANSANTVRAFQDAQTDARVAEERARGEAQTLRDTLRRTQEEAEEQGIRLEGALQGMEAQQARLKEDEAALEALAKQLEQRSLEFRIETERLRAENDVLTRNIAALEATGETFKGEVAGLKEERGKLAARITELEGVEAALKGEVAQFKGATQTLKVQIERLQEERATLNAYLGELREENEDLAQNIAQLRATRSDLDKLLSRYNSQLGAHTGQIEGAAELLQSIRDKFLNMQAPEALQQEIATLTGFIPDLTQAAKALKTAIASRGDDEARYAKILASMEEAQNKVAGLKEVEGTLRAQVEEHRALLDRQRAEHESLIKMLQQEVNELQQEVNDLERLRKERRPETFDEGDTMV